MAIPVGLVRIAEDADFKKFKEICDTNEGWKLEVNKNKITVWTKANELSNFHMVKVGIVILSFIIGIFKNRMRIFDQTNKNLYVYLILFTNKRFLDY